jgi:hypothetical protein
MRRPKLPRPDDVPLTMRQTAAMVGIRYDRFRAIWPRLVEQEGLPPPFIERRWYAPAVRAWRDLRSGVPAPGDPPAPATMTRQQKLDAQLAAVRAMH